MGGEWGRKCIKMYSSLQVEKWQEEKKKDHAFMETPDAFRKASNDLEVKENYMPWVYTLLALNIS